MEATPWRLAARTCLGDYLLAAESIRKTFRPPKALGLPLWALVGNTGEAALEYGDGRQG